MTNRYVVIGAGAIGGTVGATLFENGFSVTLVARGPHLDAIRVSGLTFSTPDASRVLPVPAVGHPGEAGIGPDDVVLLAVKSQDTEHALQELARVAPASTPIVCMQNGIANEPRALRFFESVYGMLVRAPAAHLTPGAVAAFATPQLGIFDLGRFPRGVDARAEQIAADLSASALSSVAQPDIMAWKVAKLVHNLHNACEVVLGAREPSSQIVKLLREEATVCLAAAGITPIDEETMAARRKLAITNLPAGEAPEGSSSLQSIRRDTGRVESDYLNGEITLLGRLHDIRTPANALLQRLSRDVAEHRLPAGALTEAEFLARLD